MPDRAPSPTSASGPSANGNDPSLPAAEPGLLSQLAVAGVVLDRTQLLTAPRLALPNATGIAPIDHGAYYAILFGPAPAAAPATGPAPVVTS